MESNSDLKKAKDEVLRKIGRNVILYQQMELMLKHIISFCSLSGYTDDLKDKIAKRQESVNTKTMGQLIGKFMDETHSEYKEPIRKIKKNKMYISTGITIDCCRVPH